MLRTTTVIVALVTIGVLASAQQPPTPPSGTVNISAPSFDAASVKAGSIREQGEGATPRESIDVHGGSLTMRNVRLASCVRWAYDVRDYQVSGPGWINSERCQIVAKAAGDVPVSELKLMLRALLAERFKLALHRENRELSVYALVVAKDGHKLRASETFGESSIKGNDTAVVALRTSLSEWADFLSRPMRAPVLDMTGIDGRYDFTVDVGRYITDTQGANAELDAVPRALVDQLGLKLERRKHQVEVLALDNVQKLPIEN